MKTFLARLWRMIQALDLDLYGTLGVLFFILIYVVAIQLDCIFSVEACHGTW